MNEIEREKIFMENIKKNIAENWSEFMQIKYHSEYAEGEPIPEEGVIDFVAGEIESLIKERDSIIDEARKTNNKNLGRGLDGLWKFQEFTEKISKMKKTNEPSRSEVVAYATNNLF